MTTLIVKGLVKKYHGRQVVSSVNLEVPGGCVVGLLGPNGAGKTTTFYMIVGMLKPDSGRVFLDERDITDDPMYVRARKGLGYLPQETSILRKLTAQQNILAILEVLPGQESGRKELTDSLLDELGIKHYIRYMDDMVVFSDSRQERKKVYRETDAYILNTLKLTFNPRATMLNSKMGCK